MESVDVFVGGLYNHNAKWNEMEHHGDFIWQERDWYAVGECLLSLDNISPVPIKDWLLPFGYVKPKVEKYFVHKDDLDSPKAHTRICDVYNDGNYHCSIGDNKDGIIFNVIRFIHELQILEKAINRRIITLPQPIKE